MLFPSLHIHIKKLGQLQGACFKKHRNDVIENEYDVHELENHAERAVDETETLIFTPNESRNEVAPKMMSFVV